MAKKKVTRKPPESDSARLISEVFEQGIITVRKTCRNGNAAKIYDLEGAILKRRKAATLSYLEHVRDRYGKSFQEGELDRIWARQNCAMGHSVDGLDHFYHFTLATSIWMLDALKRSGRLRDAFQCFTRDVQRLETMRLPDIYDPCHDDIVIRGMAELIHERDERDNSFQWYISDATAKRRTAVEHSAPPSDPADMNARERFNAVMNMIHPVLKERAAGRFEEKLWEFLDRFFHCAREPAALSISLQAEADMLLEECRELHSSLHVDEGRKKKPVSAPVALKQQNIPFYPADMMLSGFDARRSLDSLLQEDTALDNGYDRLDRMARRGIQLQDEADEAAETLSGLLFAAHMAPLMKREELEESFGCGVADHLLAFEVEDPYEICFGYLCLIESGSDIPWLYNAALAVLIAAVRKLPWNDMDKGPEILMETAEVGGDDVDFDLEIEGETDDTAELKPAMEPRDWTHRKSKLYQLNYLDKPLHDPDEPPELGRRVNLPQLVYGLTGIVMPRTVSDFAEMAEELTEAGVEPGLAEGMELYLQLALDVQYPSKDWEAFLQSDRFRRLNDMYGESKEDVSGAETVDIEALQRSLKNAKAEIDSLRTDLYQAQRSAEASREETDRIQSEAAGERQELISLRELVYRQANENEYEDTTGRSGAELPYTPQKRVVVFGGHDTWLKAIRPMLPGVTFVPKEQNPNVNMIRAAEVVWIQPNALSHKNYYKIINIVRQKQIPVRYFGYASAQKCALQLAELDRMG